MQDFNDIQFDDTQVSTCPFVWLVQGWDKRLLMGKPWIIHGSSSLFSPLWDIWWLVAMACKTLVVLVYLGYLGLLFVCWC